MIVPLRGRRFPLIAAAIAVVVSCGLLGALYLGGFSGGHFKRWSVDRQGYIVEEIPFSCEASYVRENLVYLANGRTGELRVMNDKLEPIRELRLPFDGTPRLLFVSSVGTIFVSEWTNDNPTFRSSDGMVWESVLPDPVWRMDEDDEGSLYAGVYTNRAENAGPAQVFKSSDMGASWVPVYVDPINEHIHTVRWDPYGGRVLIAFGDGSRRGQAYSADHGQTFHRLDVGEKQGHTDVAVTPRHLVWGSDDGSGRIYRQSRDTPGYEETLWGNQYIWFAAASGSQVYIGTRTDAGGQHAALLASTNEGLTWQKVLELEQVSSRDYEGFKGDSREISAEGWFYFSSSDRCYRVRRDPNYEIGLGRSAMRRLGRFYDRVARHLEYRFAN